MANIELKDGRTFRGYDFYETKVKMALADYLELLVERQGEVPEDWGEIPQPVFETFVEMLAETPSMVEGKLPSYFIDNMLVNGEFVKFKDEDDEDYDGLRGRYDSLEEAAYDYMVTGFDPEKDYIILSWGF